MTTSFTPKTFLSLIKGEGRILLLENKTYYFLQLHLIGYFRLVGFQCGLKNKVTNHNHLWQNKCLESLIVSRYVTMTDFYICAGCETELDF